ncbi:hypothetical protein EJ05DRAFT_538533 [Pseudovirgaria hyperparasitica]|uniref:RING-type E3 ubiquitin transferase n=1 Tax=Pseudovirgaria hyperparasitica TaxID=470096 RepID=A0A6A6W369_9PEZI|nr:uncharacterized protein EJ05DRAFT_538533 [Pseudovirgaria hyperparasitica]KAF2757302.1 hypothetical protein EJ05DRAFT_538533 [Pseudovirgaria hyperparasitica]
MRPFRFLFTLLLCLLLLTILLCMRSPAPSNNANLIHSFPKTKGSSQSVFSWSTPSILFAPTASISLTDDNTTYFLARPAMFGPTLPPKGLSGPLWAGSGFTDDAFAFGGFVGRSEGELGCSDIPDWEEGDEPYMHVAEFDMEDWRKSSNSKATPNQLRRRTPRSRHEAARDGPYASLKNFDPSLHDSSSQSPQHSTPRHVEEKEATMTAHADIQSLQEGAEIAGKVVLLSRGGCGFLDKVLWAQRRGATAVIVGDNHSGGGLISMYGRGDTTNVSIPAIFTSHTTAHLLSSLIPSGVDGKRSRPQASGSTHNVPGSSRSSPKEYFKSRLESRSAVSRILGSFQRPKQSSRDASSKEHESVSWASLEDIAKEKPFQPSTTPVPSNDDNFVIGVDDWRDPDMLSKESSTPTGTTDHSDRTSDERFKGGSTVPGSGEYAGADENGHSGWFSSFRWRGGDDNDHTSDDNLHHSSSTPLVPDEPENLHHDALWVTLSPNSMSTNPFFDTLLVLVVSPLVTLTVVYALLLLRSRIRRRRWRAPKSVVERLPVRTYHTLSSSIGILTPSPSGSPLSSPIATSPTTPLLTSTPRPVLTTRRSRPRARTTPETHASSSYDTTRHRSRSPDSEKREAGLAEWRRRYGGRQKECVVCLEEYEDGISRVMSLPCGHEFHAECITPWLTTRRRTCPICKGDVVRSLRRRDRNSPDPDGGSDNYSDADSDDARDTRRFNMEGELVEQDEQDSVAIRRNDEPAAQLPMRAEDLYAADLEQGAGELRRDAGEGVVERVWRAVEVLSGSVRERGWWGRREEADRDR